MIFNDSIDYFANMLLISQTFHATNFSQRGGVREKRAECERSCVSLARLFTWRIRKGGSRNGRARGEQTGKSRASALANALTHCVPSNALFKMSLAHVCQTNDPVGKNALARKETDIRARRVGPFASRFFFLRLFRLKMHIVNLRNSLFNCVTSDSKERGR